MPNQPDPWRTLSWPDLESWAGVRSVQKGRSYRSHVSDLQRTSTGGVVAWVRGTYRYATRVEFLDGTLRSGCTCPVGSACKHAVAAILVYLEHLKAGKVVPVAPDHDPRFTLILEAAEGEPDDDLEGDEEFDDDGFDQLQDDDREDDENTRPGRARGRSHTKSAPRQTDPVRTYLERLNESELRELLLEFASRLPAVRQALEDRGRLRGGKIKDLLREVRSEIASLGREPTYDRWGEGRGHASPSTEDLSTRLRALLEGGHADELVSLGPALMTSGKHAVEFSGDEGGELSSELQECFEIILAALPGSGLSDAEKLIWCVELELEDEYDFLSAPLENEDFWEGHPPAPGDWNGLARHLEQKLEGLTGGDDWSRNYRRGRVSRWLERALGHAGREGEVTALLEREAERTGEFVRLADHHIRLAQLEQADAVIQRGIEKTERQWPGIASQLRERWRNLRTREQDWPRLAAESAEAFFLDPGLGSFRTLETDARQAKLWGRIEPLVRTFLETGERPKPKSWPLPETGLPKRTVNTEPQAPFVRTLIDLAIAEENPDEVLRWYEFNPKKGSSPPSGWGYGVNEDRVASAIQYKHPERAMQIWRDMAGRAISRAGQRSYDEAVGHLKKVKAVLVRLKRASEWRALLEKLRETHKRKRRFVEMLDGLAGKSILES